jgi:hypothetical protein
MSSARATPRKRLPGRREAAPRFPRRRSRNPRLPSSGQRRKARFAARRIPSPQPRRSRDSKRPRTGRIDHVPQLETPTAQSDRTAHRTPQSPSPQILASRGAVADQRRPRRRRPSWVSAGHCSGEASDRPHLPHACTARSRTAVGGVPTGFGQSGCQAGQPGGSPLVRQERSIVHSTKPRARQALAHGCCGPRHMRTPRLGRPGRSDRPHYVQHVNARPTVRSVGRSGLVRARARRRLRDADLDVDRQRAAGQRKRPLRSHGHARLLVAVAACGIVGAIPLDMR